MDTRDSTAPGSVDGKTLVLSAVDIVQLIGQSVALKKNGKSFIGLCPFHTEKTPSFHVHPDRGYFYCFGCKASGNAIDFVMKRDRTEFRDALQNLAQQHNIELPRSGKNRENASLRTGLLDACSAAATFFEQNLHHPTLGQAARDYLKSRGFNDETIKHFRIGFAPATWDALATSPLMRKFDRNLLVQAGLLKIREGASGHYDTFRERLMFPIRDDAGRVIAFGGRITPEADAAAKASGKGIAKYLNSPETPLFSKSKVAYGLDLARQRIVERKTVAIVEGYTDVVMAHQFGASNVVSVLGTALTESHVNTLRRFADRIVLLFDADAAGDHAVDRALELFLTQPIDICIAALPDGLDPDEYLLAHGTEAFDDFLASAEDAMTFLWSRVSRDLRSEAGSVTQQAATVEEFLGRIAKACTSGTVRDDRWGSLLASLQKHTGIPMEMLHKRLRNVARGSARPPFRPTATHNERPSWSRQGQNDPSSESPVSKISAPRPSSRYRAERELLGVLLHLPEEWQNVQQFMDWKEFTSDNLRPLAEWYWEYQRHEGQPALEDLIAQLPLESLKSLAIEL
ncbi:MAG TPA: DNA primase, partial [Tepidisphaeraceae bacterium]